MFAAPNPYFRPVIRNRYSEVVLALDPTFFYEFKAGALGVNSSTRAGAPDAVVTDVSETGGHIDGAGDFNLSTAELNAPLHSTNQNLTTNGKYLTIETIIKFPAAIPGDTNVIISKGNDTSTNRGWMVRIDGTSGELHIYIFTNGNWLRYTSTSAIPRGDWIHLTCLLYAGHNLAKEKVWVNGVGVATTHESNFTATALTETYPMIIGGRYLDGTPPMDLPLDAQMDSIAGYDYELTDAQVFALAQAAKLA